MCFKFGPNPGRRISAHILKLDRHSASSKIIDLLDSQSVAVFVPRSGITFYFDG
jgi:hypothetical protein